MANLEDICNLNLEGPCNDDLLSKVQSLVSEDEFPPWSTKIDSSGYARVCFFESEGKKYLFKLSLRRDLFDPIKAILFGTRSYKAFAGTKLLSSNNILTPKVICYGSGGMLRPGDSFIVTEFVEHESNVGWFLYFNKDVSSRHEVMRSLGFLIGSMHAKYIYHGDLRSGNILLVRKQEGFDFVLIDNERNIQKKSFNKTLTLKNLVQLNMLPLPTVSIEERGIFYKEYLREVGFDSDFAKEISHAVWQRTKERMDINKAGDFKE